MIEVQNKNQVSLTSGATIPLGTVVYDTNGDTTLNTSSNSIKLDRGGYYNVASKMIFAPTLAGESTINMLVNGEIVASSTFTTSTTAQKITFTIPSKIIRAINVMNSNNDVTVSFTTTVAGVLYSSLVDITREV